jgi:riboflavin kinase/FMN adenylyltransferase
LQNSTAIAIGGFDGMHLGHQQLFSNLGKRGTIVVIETGYANLTPKKERERYSTYPIHYIDLDAEVIFDICDEKLQELKQNIKKLKQCLT